MNWRKTAGISILLLGVLLAVRANTVDTKVPADIGLIDGTPVANEAEIVDEVQKTLSASADGRRVAPQLARVFLATAHFLHTDNQLTSPNYKRTEQLERLVTSLGDFVIAEFALKGKVSLRSSIMLASKNFPQAPGDMTKEQRESAAMAFQALAIGCQKVR